MKFTFWVTEDCNLRCSYCYVAKKSKIMTVEVADQSIEFMRQQILTSSIKELTIGFHGGEPLLNFKLIKYLCEYILVICKKLGIRCRFQMTTNGTIFSKKIYDFIILNNIEITISVDGKEKDHNRYRVYPNGEGSFDTALQTLGMFREANYHVRVRMTVTNTTVYRLFENYKYFYDQGYKGVVAIPDTTNSNWNIADIGEYENQFNQIAMYLKEVSEEDYFYFKTNMINKFTRKCRNCDGGIQTFHIATDGVIYPCILVVNREQFIIGNVSDGIQNNKLDTLAVEYEKDSMSCKKCSLKKSCQGNICKFINYAATKNFHEPSPVFCTLNKKDYQLARLMQNNV